MNRRDLLRGSAAAAAGIGLLGCADQSDAGDGSAGSGPARSGRGSATEPLPPPESFGQAPMLAELVDQGELPPVADRLPAQPYVVPHSWLEPGRYGGTIRSITPDTASANLKDFMYGHSLLRWLNDGLDIGAGLVESWEANDDASQWTLHLRSGVKWSDGAPWTTADIMFWWEDMVLDEDHSERPPDEARSGQDTLMELTAPDDHTLVLTFDAPAPLTADRLAMWVNRGRGPTWMEPKHYLSQFHPRYNPDVPADWAAADGDFDLNQDWLTNPECPTLTGWRVVTYREGIEVEFERNPYYWCVDGEGQQLPYLDTLHFQAVQDAELATLQVQDGDLDYVHGPYAGLRLSDVAGIRRLEDESRLRVRFLDDGLGSSIGGSMMFNQDYQEPRMRELIRNPVFRQALSLAHDRATLQELVFFGRGEPTTGTMSPKAMEFHVNAEGEEVFATWRDAWSDHDPERASEMLDELGVVDQNGDGWRELPDGGELEIFLDHVADANEDVLTYCELLRTDWEDIGVRTRMNPVAPTAFGDTWARGELMTNCHWGGGGDGPNCLVFPQWMVPMEESRWAPLQGMTYAVRGTSDEGQQRDLDPYERTPPRMDPEPGGPIERLWELYDQTKVETDEMERVQLVWEMMRIHIDEGPFFQGGVGNAPLVIVVHDDLRNVPQQENLALGGYAGAAIHPTPAVYDPEVFFWAEGADR